MTFTLLGSLTGALLGWLMGFLSLFLILLILIQRGKGGGLTGALGGPGGQSAFGSKAGDTFTVITVLVASVWGLTCAFTMWLLGTPAPTPVTGTNMQAGPGDEDSETSTPGDGLILPEGEPSGLFGTPGLELDPNTTGESDTDTPSLELVPADNTETSTDAGTSTDATSETPTDETSPEGESGSDPTDTTTPDDSSTSDDSSATESTEAAVEETTDP